MSSTDVDSSTKRGRDPQGRATGHRVRPYLAILIVGVVCVPVFSAVLRAFVAFSPELLWPIAWLVMTLFGTAGPLVVVGVGFKVTKRVSFVVGHVALTVFAFASAVSLTVVIRWPALDAPWYERAAAIVWWPAWWVMVQFVVAVFVSLSWWLYRIDAFRAATGAKGDGEGGLAELLGMPKGAKVRANTIEADEFAVTATIDHPTVPANEVAKVLPAMVEKAGAVRGRSTIVPGERGGSSQVRIVHTDPFNEWRVWPGLSHPGGSFAHPFRTAYYTTGKPQWYSFARTPEGMGSKVAKGFASPNDAHLGRQGATRSGKSGDVAIEFAEALSRRDCILVPVNAAKLVQDSGWCLDLAGLAADTKQRASMVFAALRALGEFRQAVMGDPRLYGRHRRWTPLTFEELGFAAVLVAVDEGDLVLQAGDATWLATKGLSLGIYASVSISRAVTDGMASTLRSAIPTWKCFGTGVEYDKGFALSDETVLAGASPEKWGVKFPGAHYLDKAGGVPDVLYPIDCRSFQTREDFSDLRRMVEAARATFTPATWTDGEIRAMGSAFKHCQPRTILLGAFEAADRNQTPGDSPEPAIPEGEMDMTKTIDTGDPELDRLLSAPREDFTEMEREYGTLPPPNEDIPAASNPNQPGGDLDDGKPRPDGPDHAVAEFEAALVRMADRGVREFGNSDVATEMTVQMSAAWVSKRFTGLCDEGKFVQPPGLTIERIQGRSGRFMLTRLGSPDGLDV